jgi:hypothetical protein
MIALLTLLLFPVAIQYERGGAWHVLFPLYFIVAVLDVIANYTEISLLCLAWPEAGKPTVSMRIPGILLQGGWRGALAYDVARYLNYFAPGHKHITEVAQ